MKTLILRIITAWAALRAGKVFTVDTISVIASCQEDADIITGALKVLKAQPENHKWYQLVTENIRMILVARNRHLPQCKRSAVKRNTSTRRQAATSQVERKRNVFTRERSERLHKQGFWNLVKM